jgi:hypothetical protein
MEVYKAPKQVAHFPFHFSVMDEDSYRFKKDVTSHAAITAFGDTEFAARLLEVFCAFVSKSERVELAARACPRGNPTDG